MCQMSKSSCLCKSKFVYTAVVTNTEFGCCRFDDIAYNEENPTPGVIINRPGGPNVRQQNFLLCQFYQLFPLIAGLPERS